MEKDDTYISHFKSQFITFVYYLSLSSKQDGVVSRLIPVALVTMSVEYLGPLVPEFGRWEKSLQATEEEEV